MHNNNNDIFEFSKTTNAQQDFDNNFFLSEDKIATKPLLNDAGRRLNDFDSNLLREDAYKDVTDDLFKLEYKISRHEDEIKSINLQIQAAENINDSTSLANLKTKLNLITIDYNNLVSIYKEKSFSAKFSGNLSKLLSSKLSLGDNSFIQNSLNFLEVFLSKLSGNFAKFMELKKSLNRLESINKSVDDLINMKIPYGEDIDKYEKLSKYIIRANTIQSQISNFMKK